MVWPPKAVIVVVEGVNQRGVPTGSKADCGHSCLYVLTGMTFPSAPVSILHSRQGSK